MAGVLAKGDRLSSSYAETPPPSNDNQAAAASPLAPAAPLTKPDLAPASSTADRLSASLAKEEARIAGIKIPTLTTVPPPQVKSTTPQEMWGSTAMVLATLGSLMTRTPMTTAMNAAAGVMNAFKKGDQDAANAAYKTWEISNKNAMEIANFQMDAYKAAVANVTRREGNIIAASDSETKTAIAKATALAHAFSDPVALDMMGQDGLKGLMDLIDGRTTTLKQHEENSTTVADFKSAVEDGLKLQESPEWKALMADPQANVERLKAMAQPIVDRMNKLQPDGAGAKASDQRAKTIDFMAQARLKGDTAVLSGLGWGKATSQMKMKVMDRVQQLAEEQNISGEDLALRQAQYAGITSEARTFGTQAGRVTSASIEANKLADQALVASANVPRSKFKFIAGPEQTVEAATNDPALARLVVATNGLINTYARAINPNGPPRISDKEHAREMLSTVQDQGAYAAAVDQMKIEIEAALQSPSQAMSGIGTSGDKPAGDGVVDYTTYFGGQ